MEEILTNLYYNPLTGFQGLDKLYKKAKAIDTSITKLKVKDWLKEQETEQITKQEKSTKHNYDSIISPEVGNNFQMDIMYLPNARRNQGYNYLLTTIDVYSRKAWVQPIREIKAQPTLNAFIKILKSVGRIPDNINIDAGSEFVNRDFTKYFRDNGIQTWVSNSRQENKNAIIERFHRTLRNIIIKYETALKKPYIGDLQKLVANYNDTKHSTTKETPDDIWNGKADNHQKYKYVIYSFEVGDRVRHKVMKNKFDKASSSINFTKEIYKIERIVKNSYYLEDNDENILAKPFRGYELLLAVGEDPQRNIYDIKNKLDKKQKTINRRLKREGIDPSNIID